MFLCSAVVRKEGGGHQPPGSLWGARCGVNSVLSLSPSPNHTEDKMLRPWPGLATQDLPPYGACVLVATFFSLCLLVLWVSAWTLPPRTRDLGQSIICCPCCVTLKASLGLKASLADICMVWVTLLWPSLSAGPWSWCLGPVGKQSSCG